MNIINQDKTKLVNSVFTKVHKNYDLMNDLMSLGVHRLWKQNLINWMNPQSGNKIIDVAAGTGDLAKMISKKMIIIIFSVVWSLIKKCLKQVKKN